MNDHNRFSRRDFLGLLTFGLGGLISLAIGIPAISYIISPARRRIEETNFIPLGAADRVTAGEPTLFRTKITRKSGWITEETELSFYVLTDNNREFSALSNICTHLGCRVRWVPDEQKFFCPCHNGVFDKNGAVVSGPPPRPLNQYEVKEENGQLFVEYG
jgi:menaquinol-cytochrome c reductase iron-sulfur subunit